MPCIVRGSGPDGGVGGGVIGGHGMYGYEWPWEVYMGGGVT